jgi:hypothetical protein
MRDMKSFAMMFFVYSVAACVGDAATPADDTIASALETAPASTESVSGCVSIQWCNEPNSAIGTVCQVKASCQSQCPDTAIQDACHSQARAVCGTIIQPFDIVCNH